MNRRIICDTCWRLNCLVSNTQMLIQRCIILWLLLLLAFLFFFILTLFFFLMNSISSILTMIF